MRGHLTKHKLYQFMKSLAKNVKSAGKVYFCGGATALLLDTRESTIDIDLKFDPEPQGVFEAISKLKNDLDINIELASPDDFIPTGTWQENSLHIDTINSVSYYHYDLTAQALAKLERGHEQDLQDVKDLLDNNHITTEQITKKFAEIKNQIIKYPSIDAEKFEKKVYNFLDNYE